MSTDAIDPQLLQDCHLLGAMQSGTLLLHRNASLHWFILVPSSPLRDVLDLPLDQAQGVFQDCAAVSAFIKNQLSYPKVNFAGLGNQVAQMHLHIIGRHPGDACWPDPVWGNLQHAPIYSGEKLENLVEQLVAALGLLPHDG